MAERNPDELGEELYLPIAHLSWLSAATVFGAQVGPLFTAAAVATGHELVGPSRPNGHQRADGTLKPAPAPPSHKSGASSS